MKRQFIYPITEKEQGMTVEELLLARGYSRHLIIDLKKSPEYLTLNGSHVYVTRKMADGDVLTVTLPDEQSSPGIVPTPMKLDIRYEDDDLIVINKSADLPIHPSQGNYANTLANGMAWYFAEKNEPFVYRVINRLDRDTTGLLILAKHALSACILSDMVQKRQIRRTYLAAASGDVRDVIRAPQNGVTPDMPTGDSPMCNPIPDSQVSDNLIPGDPKDESPVSGCSFTIDAPIARVDGSTIERQVDFAHGEPARTHVRLLAYDSARDASILELKLETGRTHQIRVHCGYIGHPLFGDFLYHPDFRYIGRQSLHSWKLEFHHPITGNAMQFTAPIPEDMQWVSESLTARGNIV